MSQQGDEAGNRQVSWPIFAFAVALGIPFSGWIREVLGDSPMGRLTFQDFGFLVLFLPLIRRVWHFRVTWDVAIVGFVNVGILISALANANAKGFVDVIIHVYLFFMYFVLRNLLNDTQNRRSLVRGLLVAFYASLGVAVVAKLAAIPFLPQVTLALQGTFLNGSQYGSFISVIAVPLYAAYFAQLASGQPVRELDQARWVGILLPVAVSLSPIVIFYTSKRSAMLSLLLSALASVAVLVKVKPIRTVRMIFGVTVASVGVLAVAFAFYGDLIADLGYLADRYLKANQIVAEDGFFVANMRYARDAFLANPLFGQGYGSHGITSLGTNYEVHSTYLKWLGDGGLITAIPGVLMLLMTCYAIYAAAVRGMGGGRYHELFLLVFFLGLVVAMAYAYLPRRREYWVVIAYVMAVVANHRDSARAEAV